MPVYLGMNKGLPRPIESAKAGSLKWCELLRGGFVQWSRGLKTTPGRNGGASVRHVCRYAGWQCRGASDGQRRFQGHAESTRASCWLAIQNYVAKGILTR